MKWIRIQSSPAYEQFLLQEKGITVLNLRHNQETNTLRLKTGNEKRLMMIDTSQVDKNRIGLLNEYGIEIGGLTFTDTKDNAGEMVIEENHFRYVLTANPAMEIQIYDMRDDRLLMRCGLVQDTVNAGKGLNNRVCFVQDNYTPMVAGLLWYLHVSEINIAATA